MIDKIIEAILSDINPVTILLLLIIAIYTIIKFVYGNWDKIKSWSESRYQSRKQKEQLYETVKEMKDEIEHTADEQSQFIQQQLSYKNQSQVIRSTLEGKTDIAIKKSEEAICKSEETLAEVKEITKIVKKLQLRQEEINVERKAQKLNELRTNLLNSYRYYISNPEQTWNEMEAHAFWLMFKDYENLGGDDYMHEIVQPAMNKLTVTPLLHEEES